MSLKNTIDNQIKESMLNKSKERLVALRAIKSAVLLAKTAAGGAGELSEEDTIKLLQRLVKQRKESAAIFNEQGRVDLAAPEEAQAEVIASFLPEQLSKEEVEQIIIEIIDQLGAEGMKDMGKVMGMATKKLGGKAEGKLIASLVKEKLS